MVEMEVEVKVKAKVEVEVRVDGKRKGMQIVVGKVKKRRRAT